MKLDKIGTESVEILKPEKAANTFVATGLGKSLEEINLKHDIGKDVGRNLGIWCCFPPYDYPRDFPLDSGLEKPQVLDSEVEAIAGKVYDIARKMFDGEGKSLGLKDINGWKRNLEHYDAQIRQQAGYAAEVIGTAKDNLAAKLEKTGLTTHRTDDLPGEFKKNDPLVDKVRKNEVGQIVERIQVKFIGSDGRQLLKKLASPKFGKYFDSKVDKIEIPSDYYDEIFSNNLIKEEISGLERQLEHAKQAGKADVAAGIQSRIDRFQKIEKSLLRSRVSSSEARQAVIYPKTYIARLFAKDIALSGLKQGALAGLVTAAVSTVENTKKVMDGEITPMEAFGDVAKKTAVAGGIGTGIGFISEAATLTMAGSSHALIRSIANMGIPAAIVSIGIDSFDAIVDYSRGTIDGKELAYDLGASTARVTGAIVGAKAGAAIGTALLPGAGTVVGATIGLTGGVVGTAVASHAYKTAVELGNSEQAQALLDKTKELATSTIEQVKQLETGEVVAMTAGAAVGGVAGYMAGTVVAAKAGAASGAVAGGKVGKIVGAAVGAATDKGIGMAATMVGESAGMVLGNAVGGAVGGVIGLAAAPVGAVAGAVGGAYVGLKGYRAARKFIDTPNKSETLQKAFNGFFAENKIPISV